LSFAKSVNFGFFDYLLADAYGGEAARLPLYDVTFAPIALGVALAYLLHHPTSFAILFRILGAKWSFVMILGAMILLLEFCPVKLDHGWPRFGVHLIFILLLGSLVVRQDHYAAPFLAFPPIAHIGVISYGMYVYHVLVLHGVDSAHLNISPMLHFTVVAAITVLVSDLSFRFFETPFLKLRSRFHGNCEATDAAPKSAQH
jgi:peptidoglycan/LPS O-acetylase OafA/YrhL